MSDTKTFSQITIQVISIILKAPFVKRVSNEMHQSSHNSLAFTNAEYKKAFLSLMSRQRIQSP